MRPFQLWSWGDVLKSVSVTEPRLASWEKQSHPSQIRLRAYLDDLTQSVGPLAGISVPLFLHLRVDVSSADRLLKHYDLENYLTPLFGGRAFNARQFVLVGASKQVGGGSRLSIGLATSRRIELAGWEQFACRAGSGSQTKRWKAELRHALDAANRSLLPDGPVEVQLAWRCSPSRNWVSLWKPTGDAMGPVLGEDNPDRPFCPRDDRIVSLILHREDDLAMGHDIDVGMWWRTFECRDSDAAL